MQFFILILVILSATTITGCTNHGLSSLNNGNQNNNQKTHNVNITAIDSSITNAHLNPISIDNTAPIEVWYQLPKPPSNIVAQGAGNFVAIKATTTTDTKLVNDAPSEVFVSNDGYHWKKTSELAGNYRDIIYGNHCFYAVGHGLPPKHNQIASIIRSCETSANIGTNWQLVYPSTDTKDTAPAMTNISHINNTYLTSGLQGAILTSTDGKKWKEQRLSNISAFYASDYMTSSDTTADHQNHGNYLLLGDPMTLYASTDTLVWNKLSPTPSENSNKSGWRHLIYNSNWLLIQTNNTLYRYDRKQQKWSAWQLPDDINISNGQKIIHLNAGAEEFVVVTNKQQVLKSIDGIHWETIARIEMINDMNNDATLDCHAVNSQSITQDRCDIINQHIIKIPAHHIGKS